jgi:hypothetical protein
MNYSPDNLQSQCAPTVEERKTSWSGEAERIIIDEWRLTKNVNGECNAERMLVRLFSTLSRPRFSAL